MIKKLSTLFIVFALFLSLPMNAVDGNKTSLSHILVDLERELGDNGINLDLSSYFFNYQQAPVAKELFTRLVTIANMTHKSKDPSSQDAAIVGMHEFLEKHCALVRKLFMTHDYKKVCQIIKGDDRVSHVTSTFTKAERYFKTVVEKNDWRLTRLMALFPPLSDLHSAQGENNLAAAKEKFGHAQAAQRTMLLIEFADTFANDVEFEFVFYYLESILRLKTFAFYFAYFEPKLAEYNSPERLWTSQTAKIAAEKVKVVYEMHAGFRSKLATIQVDLAKGSATPPPAPREQLFTLLENTLRSGEFKALKTYYGDGIIEGFTKDKPIHDFFFDALMVADEKLIQDQTTSYDVSSLRIIKNISNALFYEAINLPSPYFRGSKLVGDWSPLYSCYVIPSVAVAMRYSDLNLKNLDFPTDVKLWLPLLVKDLSVRKIKDRDSFLLPLRLAIVSGKIPTRQISVSDFIKFNRAHEERESSLVWKIFEYTYEMRTKDGSNQFNADLGSFLDYGDKLQSYYEITNINPTALNDSFHDTTTPETDASRIAKFIKCTPFEFEDCDQESARQHYVATPEVGSRDCPLPIFPRQIYQAADIEKWLTKEFSINENESAALEKIIELRADKLQALLPPNSNRDYDLIPNSEYRRLLKQFARQFKEADDDFALVYSFLSDILNEAKHNYLNNFYGDLNFYDTLNKLCTVFFLEKFTLRDITFGDLKKIGEQMAIIKKSIESEPFLLLAAYLEKQGPQNYSPLAINRLISMTRPAFFEARIPMLFRTKTMKFQKTRTLGKKINDALNRSITFSEQGDPNDETFSLFLPQLPEKAPENGDATAHEEAKAEREYHNLSILFRLYLKPLREAYKILRSNHKNDDLSVLLNRDGLKFWLPTMVSRLKATNGIASHLTSQTWPWSNDEFNAATEFCRLYFDKQDLLFWQMLSYVSAFTLQKSLEGVVADLTTLWDAREDSHSDVSASDLANLITYADEAKLGSRVLLLDKLFDVRHVLNAKALYDLSPLRNVLFLEFARWFDSEEHFHLVFAYLKNELDSMKHSFLSRFFQRVEPIANVDMAIAIQFLKTSSDNQILNGMTHIANDAIRIKEALSSKPFMDIVDHYLSHKDSYSPLITGALSRFQDENYFDGKLEFAQENLSMPYRSQLLNLKEVLAFSKKLKDVSCKDLSMNNVDWGKYTVLVEKFLQPAVDTVAILRTASQRTRSFAFSNREDVLTYTDWLYPLFNNLLAVHTSPSEIIASRSPWGETVDVRAIIDINLTYKRADDRRIWDLLSYLVDVIESQSFNDVAEKLENIAANKLLAWYDKEHIIKLAHQLRHTPIVPAPQILLRHVSVDDAPPCVEDEDLVKGNEEVGKESAEEIANQRWLDSLMQSRKRR